MTEKPRTQNTPRGQSTSTPHGQAMRSSRAIPAQLKRDVWERDHGRCGFVGEEGRHCNETRGLEYAHVRAWSKGGEHRLDNLGLRCRAHNAYEANQDYGVQFMQEKRRARQPVHRVKEPGRGYRGYQVRISHGLALHDDAAIELSHSTRRLADRFALGATLGRPPPCLLPILGLP